MISGMRFLCIATLCFCLLLIYGCGESKVPAGDVGVVKGAPVSSISKKEFNVWLRAAAARDGDAMGLPLAPGFKGCVDAQKSNISASEKRSRCRQRLARLRRQTMSFLISSRWIMGQAQADGIAVSDAEVDAELDKQLAGFASAKAKESFLRQSQMNRQQLLFRTRLNLLASRLRREAAGGAVTPSESQIRDFYKINAKRFGQPASREIDLVTTASADKAILAKVLIEKGASFSTVNRRYGSTAEARRRPTRITVSRGRVVGPDLERAVFSAPKGKLVGPVQGGYVYYVFRVISSTPSTRQSLAQARPLVVDLLEAQLRRERVSEYLDKLEADWRKRTLCAPGYVVTECSNGS